MACEVTIEKKFMDLSNDMLIQILLKSPVKSILLLKFLCKSLYVLISHSQFPMLHFETDAAHNERLIYISTKPIGALSMECNSSVLSLASEKLNFEFGICNHLEILGSCRGFLLMRVDKVLWIWNPATNCRREVEWPIYVKNNLLLDECVFGLTYNKSKDDFLILVSNNYESRLTYMTFFSFRTNMWKDIDTAQFNFNSLRAVSQTASLLNGALHWLAWRHVNSKSVIVSFILEKMTWLELPLPFDFDFQANRSRRQLLSVIGGKLHISDAGHESVVIWKMDEYNVPSLWNRIFVIPRISMPYATVKTFRPLCYTGSGDVIGTYECLDSVVLTSYVDQAQQQGLLKLNSPVRDETYTAFENIYTVLTEFRENQQWSRGAEEQCSGREVR